MPIYEYYSPDTNRIYSFYAKTLAQGRQVPRCPDRPGARMVKLVSAFSVAKRGKGDVPDAGGPALGDSAGGPDDARMEAAMGAMEREFSNIDENDPRAMARMMRRLSEVTGEKLDEPMEEAVRKLEEGADPESLEASMGEAFGDGPEGDMEDGFGGPPAPERGQPEPKSRPKVRRPPPTRDPKLYDYE